MRCCCRSVGSSPGALNSMINGLPPATMNRRSGQPLSPHLTLGTPSTTSASLTVARSTLASGPDIEVPQQLSGVLSL